VFSQNCSSCHGLSGQGGNGGPDLTSRPATQSTKRVAAQVTNGGGGMPAFKGSLTPKQIRDVAAYVAGKIAKK
jgi:mono/diheme cytochrome c family protein